MQLFGFFTAGTSVPPGGLCPKSLWKIHPALCLLLLNILISDPDNTLALSLSRPLILSVLTPGKHNSTPITACTGYNPASLTFTTPVTGGTPPYSYQWQLNNLAIPGETLSSYDPPQMTSAGSYSYNCAITDAAGDVVYTVAKSVTIVPDPVVTILGGGIVCQNSMTWLTATITHGTGSYTCQWESGPAANGPWSHVPGISENYSPPTSVAGTVYYHVLIDPSTVSCNKATSSAVPVTVVPPLLILVQPASQSDCKGNSVIFEAVISGGSPPITCTWQRKNPTDPFFSTITSDPDITFPSAGTMHVDKIGSTANPDGTQYQVVISDGCGSAVTSMQPATLTVNEISGITPITNNLQICEGGSLSYHVTTSTLPLAYQWLKDGAEIQDGAVYSGATTPVLLISLASPAETGRYQVRVIFPITTPNNNGGGASSCSETSTLDRWLFVNPLPATSAIYHE